MCSMLPCPSRTHLTNPKGLSGSFAKRHAMVYQGYLVSSVHQLSSLWSRDHPSASQNSRGTLPSLGAGGLLLLPPKPPGVPPKQIQLLLYSASALQTERNGGFFLNWHCYPGLFTFQEVFHKSLLTSGRPLHGTVFGTCWKYLHLGKPIHVDIGFNLVFSLLGFLI